MPAARIGARSQTDLSLRSHAGESPTLPLSTAWGRPAISVISDGRSSSSPVMSTTTQMDSDRRMLSFSARMPGTNTPRRPARRRSKTRRDRLIDRRTWTWACRPNFASSPVVDGGPGSPPLTRPGHQRKGSQFYQEPSITCARCGKEHIEYDVHYHCSTCSNGTWDICLDCYRAGKGCLHWFGFGNLAWQKWRERPASRRHAAS